jgi:GNAT superfamily N-acetyltransferase
MDIDEFDLRSRYIGAFTTQGGAERLVASCRMILPEGYLPRLPAMVDIAGAAGLAARRSHGNLLPSQAGFDFSPVLRRSAAANAVIVEFSRMACLPAIRGQGIGSGLIHCLYALARIVGADIGVGAAPHALRAFYERHGCTILGDCVNHNFHKALLALIVPLRDLPAEMWAVDRVERLLRTEGRVRAVGSELCLDRGARAAGSQPAAGSPE